VQCADELGAWTAIDPELPKNVLRSYVEGDLERIVIRDVPMSSAGPQRRWLRLQVQKP
jgi:hypothetical protein